MIPFFILGLFILLLIGLPVAFSLGLLATGGMYMFEGTRALSQIPMVGFKALNDFALTALPMYLLMSQILLTAGMGKDLFEFASKWVRHLPGGLGIATIASCTVFAAISGSSVATAATVGMIAIPEMTKRGYDIKTILGLVAAGGTLGILIPPSVPMILYGSVTDESIGKLFMAGVVPGLILSLLFMFYAAITGRKFKDEPASWQERWEITKKAIWGLFLPVLVIGGIYTGIVTPTEAAALGVVYSLLVGILIYRTINLKSMKEILLSTAKVNAMILLIIVGAMLYGHIITALRIPHEITQWFLGFSDNPWMIMLLINILLIILGFFLETISIILITLPILYPVVVQLGFDPVWFAVLMVINMELALITPPVGLNLFVLKGIAPDTSITAIVKGVLPFIVIIVIFMVALALCPSIATLLPNNVQ